jgi:hypothetical protein
MFISPTKDSINDNANTDSNTIIQIAINMNHDNMDYELLLPPSPDTSQTSARPSRGQFATGNNPHDARPGPSLDPRQAAAEARRPSTSQHSFGGGHQNHHHQANAYNSGGSHNIPVFGRDGGDLKSFDKPDQIMMARNSNSYSHVMMMLLRIVCVARCFSVHYS